VLDQLATGQQLDADTGSHTSDSPNYYGIQHGVATMLAWLVPTTRTGQPAWSTTSSATRNVG
jgi:hypothetical protein